MRSRTTKQSGSRTLERTFALIKGVPISFNTHWRDEGGFVDIETSIHVHEAIEKEFGIDVKDRNILIADVEMAYYVVTQHHDSL
jgi:hypothetical protein